jgi:DNA end-binding protein Ku
MVKGYEFAKDQYVIFTPEELKELEEKGTQTVEITAFVPASSIDPIYYDKAYYLAPDKGGARPYALLSEGMRKTGRSALGRWAWRGKQHIVQLRAVEGGLVLQQLLYAEEVRKLSEIDVEKADVKNAELDLAVQLIEQHAAAKFDPDAYEDDVKKRIEAAVQRKVEGQEIATSAEPESGGAQVIDLMEALRASLAKTGAAAPAATRAAVPAQESARKPPKRVQQEVQAKAPAKERARAGKK